MAPPDTIWHKESLKLKEIFGTREGFEICPNKFSQRPIISPPVFSFVNSIASHYEIWVEGRGGPEGGHPPPPTVGSRANPSLHADMHDAHGVPAPTGGGGGIFHAGENMNLQILARRNLCHFLKMSEQIMYSSQ